MLCTLVFQMLWCTELVVNPRKHQVAVEEMALHTNRWPSYPKLTLLLILLVVMVLLLWLVMLL